MPRQDTVEFVIALVLGAIVGSAVTLLVRPAPMTRTERILKELRPYRIRIRHDRHRVRAGLRESAEASLDIGRTLRAASRDLAGHLRAELIDSLAMLRDRALRSTSGRVSGNGRHPCSRAPGEKR